MARKRIPLKLVPTETVFGVRVEPFTVTDPAVRLLVLRRVPAPAFQVHPVDTGEAGKWFWLVGLRNGNASPEQYSDYVYTPPKKSKRPALSPDEIAIEASHRLSECRGWVCLQEWRDGYCAFAAVYVANSLWTFCLWSTDPGRAPMRKPWPDGWEPGQDFPEGLKRTTTTSYPPPGCHHEHCWKGDRSDNVKLAQKLLP